MRKDEIYIPEPTSYFLDFLKKGRLFRKRNRQTKGLKMNNELKETKTKNEVFDRIPLSKNASEIVRESIKVMMKKYPTVKNSKRDLVNWLIEENFKELTPSIEKALHELSLIHI